MTKEREALRMALEALHGFIPYLPLKDEAQCGRYDQAITAIKEALAQPEQELVAWMVTSEMQDGTKNTYPLTGRFKDVKDVCDFGNPIPLYTTPPQRKPLTDEMKKQCPYTAYPSQQAAFMDGWLKAEAAHGIKENT